MSAAVPFQPWRLYRLIGEQAPIYPIGGIAPDASLTYLGFEDHSFIALCIDVERIFQIRLSPDALREVRTAGDLVRITAEAAFPSLPQQESER